MCLHAPHDAGIILTVTRKEPKSTSPPFSRSNAPSPESPAGDKPTGKPILLVDHVEEVEEDDDVVRVHTPKADSRSSISTISAFASPMKSYLACPQTHERRALSLSMDDDAEEDGSEFEGSVILGLKRLPGVYKARKTSHHFSLSKPPEMSHAMERYLASAVSDEPSGPQVEKELPNVPADQPHALAEEPTPDVPGNAALPIPSESDAIPALPVPLEASQMPSLNPDRPISVGSERSAPDSGIEDLEAADIYLRL